MMLLVVFKIVGSCSLKTFKNTGLTVSGIFNGIISCNVIIEGQEIFSHIPIPFCGIWYISYLFFSKILGVFIYSQKLLLGFPDEFVREKLFLNLNLNWNL